MLCFRFKLACNASYNLPYYEIGAFPYLRVMQVIIYLDLYWLHLV